MPARKLTQRWIDQVPIGTNQVFRDAAVTGLLLKVGKTCKSYAVQRELWAGDRGRRRLIKTVRVTLGRTDELGLEEARTRAMHLLSEIRAGRDPNAIAQVDDTSVWTLAQGYDAYTLDTLKERPGAARTVEDMQQRLHRYLGDWCHLPLPDITPRMCRERHDQIIRDVKARAKTDRVTGARAANQTLRDLRAVWNRASKVFRQLPPNPVHAVREARERAEHHQIQPDDLRHWFDTVEKLPGPLRRVMHQLGLFSGLRPGNLVSIERDWVRLPKEVISFPAHVMKGRRVFDLPLSEHMCELVRKALQIGDLLHQGTAYLFPARSRDGKRVIATQTWKEDLLPNATGHALRHTYSNMAALARIDEVSRQMLMAQKIPGIKGRYLDETTLFGRLLEDQQRVSNHILGVIRVETRSP